MNENESSNALLWLGGTVAVLFVLWATSFGIYALTQRSAPQAGEIGVIRNAPSAALFTDWFDSHTIRGVIPNGSGSKWIGLGSDVHYYPVDSQQRFFRLQTCFGEKNTEESCQGADDVAISVPTADGVQVGIEGTFYLDTTFNNSPKGLNLLKGFDAQYGTRTFPFGAEELHAWDGTNGWKAFLGSLVEPVIANNLRQTIAGVRCEELVSSCALVQNAGSTRTVDFSSLSNHVTAVQNSLNTGLQSDLNATLTAPGTTDAYFGNIHFRLTKVDLPKNVQEAIDNAQASFAQVTQAQAKVKSANLEAQANEQRQHGYEHCPACAQIDTLKAIPSNVTTFAPGANFAVTAK